MNNNYILTSNLHNRTFNLYSELVFELELSEDVLLDSETLKIFWNQIYSYLEESLRTMISQKTGFHMSAIEVTGITTAAVTAATGIGLAGALIGTAFAATGIALLPIAAGAAYLYKKYKKPKVTIKIELKNVRKGSLVFEVGIFILIVGGVLNGLKEYPKILKGYNELINTMNDSIIINKIFKKKN